MNQIKPIDLDIIRLLRKNARMSLVDIQKISGIPTSTSYDRLKYISSLGLITSHSSILSELYLSSLYRVVMFISNDVDISYGAIYYNTVYRVDSGYIIEAYFPTKKLFTAFKKIVPNLQILRIKKILKKEGFLF